MSKEPNQEQLSVINELNDNILLFASAGTGKTFTVAQKVKKIVESGLAKPEEILCLTFTIKACEEMQEDILSYNEGAKDVVVRTIHSFCYQLIKEEAKRISDCYTEPVICDEVDQEEILQKLIPERIAVCDLEQLISKCNVESIKNLFTCDVVYLHADHEEPICSPALPVGTIRRSGFFWKLSDGDYLNADGVLPGSDARALLSATPSDIKCPECNKKQTQNGNFCSECGHGFRTYIPLKKFPLGKHGGYRNLISMLKHYRVVYGYQTKNEAEDYQNTSNRLNMSMPERLKKTFTYLHDRSEETDTELYRAMEQYKGTVLHEYQTLLRQSNRLDFDDLIIEARNFLADPKICERWKQRYKLIIVDEMQDTSELEYDVLKRIFPRSHVMMCGDFFQTIYEWQGSQPRAVLADFQQTF